MGVVNYHQGLRIVAEVSLKGWLGFVKISCPSKGGGGL